MILSFLNVGVHGPNKIRNLRVKSRFQILKFSQFLKIFIEKHELYLGDILVH